MANRDWEGMSDLVESTTPASFLIVGAFICGVALLAPNLERETRLTGITVGGGITAGGAGMSQNNRKKKL